MHPFPEQNSHFHMQTVVLKFLGILTRALFPATKQKYRYYIRDNKYSRLLQLRYFFKDYYRNKKYKNIIYQGEFQQELTFVLPFAYWHYLNGTLEKTISCKGTKEIYFFSTNHEERFGKRDWQHNVADFEIPNMTHTNSFSSKKWAKVPLKQHYKNRVFVYEKPILIIANKYNIEWEASPVNFFDIPLLEKIFESYKNKYQIIYNRPTSTNIVSDNSEILDLNEFQWITEKYPDILIMSDLYKKHSCVVNNYNHLQLMVYANANHFVSVHGGTAALASYFGGNNIILSKSGLEHYFNEFETIFPALSNARILHAKTEGEVLEMLSKYYDRIDNRKVQESNRSLLKKDT